MGDKTGVGVAFCIRCSMLGCGKLEKEKGVHQEWKATSIGVTSEQLSADSNLVVIHKGKKIS